MGQTPHMGASKLRLAPIAAAETRQDRDRVGGVQRVCRWGAIPLVPLIGVYVYGCIPKGVGTIRFPSQEVKSLPVRGGKQEQYLHFLLYILHLSFFTILHPP
jgi:hypothetical protein